MCYLPVLCVMLCYINLYTGVRQFLHRMVVCLDSDILQFIPMAMESLLKQADARELYDFIPFVNQLVQKFKVRLSPDIFSLFFVGLSDFLIYALISSLVPTIHHFIASGCNFEIIIIIISSCQDLMCCHCIFFMFGTAGTLSVWNVNVMFSSRSRSSSFKDLEMIHADFSILRCSIF